MEDGLHLERKIDAIVGEYVDPEGPGLSVLVGRDDRVLVHKGYGRADVAGGQAITPRSRFVIGSVTKQFTAGALMLLRHRGRLTYDDPAARWLPGLPDWAARVTLRQLLHHTGGVREYLDEQWWKEAAEGKYPDLSSLLEHIAGLGDLEFEPGTRWRYSNSGYVLLGAVVERASGQTFASFLRDNVFVPLGMDHTLVGESDERPAGLATGYRYRGKDDYEPAPWHFAVIGWADGNVISTTGDLFRWSQSLYTSRLLPLAVLAEAIVPCRPLDPAFSRYGFGQLMSERRGVREVHHGGGTLGFVSALNRFPDERLTIVLLSNAAGIELADITGRVAEACLGDRLAPLAAASLAPGDLEEKRGVYLGTPRGEVVRVTVRSSTGGGLEAAVEHGEESAGEPAVTRWHRLLPVSRDLFLMNPHADVYLSFIREGTRVAGARLLAGGAVQEFLRQDT
ncbi:MAG TPA: serine hydrolase domain-containing protein [Bacillota bacterium]|nr:serine hydrolase domain-containing protein [Bacillota bacterium]